MRPAENPQLTEAAPALADAEGTRLSTAVSARQRIAVIGAGWAGCAAAVAATRAGHAVTLFEAAAEPGGRARNVSLPDGLQLDNGQHILIGAYSACLQLMQELGVNLHDALLRLPLDLRTPDGAGLAMPFPAGHPQIDVLRAVVNAGGWNWRERFSLLRTAARWQWQGFKAPDSASVLDACRGLHPRILQDLVTPLCVSAFNRVPESTSGAVFLRVMQDALLAERGGSDVLIARTPLGNLLPRPAMRWLQDQGASVHCGLRVRSLTRTGDGNWHLDCAADDDTLPLPQFHQVILAAPAREAARLTSGISPSWSAMAQSLQRMPIATTYAWCENAAENLPPMRALRDTPERPAQFVFCHKDRLRPTPAGRTARLLAFVTSCCDLERETLEQAIRLQAQEQLGLKSLDIIATLIDRRATFVCSPGLQRPPASIAHGLHACGDYVEGPYPATLEGAVRSGLAAAAALATSIP